MMWQHIHSTIIFFSICVCVSKKDIFYCLRFLTFFRFEISIVGKETFTSMLNKILALIIKSKKIYNSCPLLVSI